MKSLDTKIRTPEYIFGKFIKLVFKSFLFDLNKIERKTAAAKNLFCVVLLENLCTRYSIELSNATRSLLRGGRRTENSLPVVALRYI